MDDRAVRFLGSELPALLSGGRSGAETPDAVIQMIVVDRDDCDLAYLVSRDGIAVQLGISDRCDLTLSFLDADLGALAEGRLDVARAVRTRRLKVMGDTRLLSWMSERLIAR